MMRISAVALACALCAPGGAEAAAPWASTRSARSGADTVALVELYTSEGCSSCPPADRWLSDNAARLGEIVPLALHVDYWNSIGWPDPFSQARFSDRQREHAALFGSSNVYTPELLVAGHEVRERGGASAAVRRINQTPARAAIAVELEPRSPSWALTVRAQVPAAALRAHAALYVAVFENALDVDVRAGENRGRTLHHDFVVRAWLGPFPVDASGAVELHRALALATDWKPAALGVAAFVEDRTTGDVLQALALPPR